MRIPCVPFCVNETDRLLRWSLLNLTCVAWRVSSVVSAYRPTHRSSLPQFLPSFISLSAQSWHLPINGWDGCQYYYNRYTWVIFACTDLGTDRRFSLVHLNPIHIHCFIACMLMHQLINKTPIPESHCRSRNEIKSCCIMTWLCVPSEASVFYRGDFHRTDRRSFCPTSQLPVQT